MTFIKDFNHRNFDSATTSSLKFRKYLYIRSAKCLFGEKSVRQNVRSAKCLSAKCLSAKCPATAFSEGKFRQWSMYHGCVYYINKRRFGDSLGIDKITI
jgi:sarcosine oxidase delta subunit